jgi:hypothetical protein
MANNIWNNYTEKTATPVDADEVMVRDSTDGKNKRLLFGTFWKWVAKKLNEATISELQTSNKTIIGAINALNSDCSKTKVFTMQTEYGHLYLKKNVNVVGVYGLFENLPLNTKQIKITKDYKDFNPNYNHAVLDVKSGEAPFVTVGSIWLYPDGQTMQLYKPANLSKAYIVGNYAIQA